MELRDIVSAPGVLPVDEGRGRVLIVEDEMSQRMATLRILKRAGYTCVAATSTAEARQLLREGSFGVVVTDLRMFNEDGIELVRHTQDNYPDTFVIVVTGFADDATQERVRQAGGFALLHKPFEHEELTALVDRAFEERQDAVALRRHRSG